MAGILSPGTRAPDFEGKDQDGRPVRLQDFAGRPLVLYFYPADETFGCTREACAFRDEMRDFEEIGAAVVGVSPQDEASHRSFRAKHNLSFPLLADPSRTIISAYGTNGLLGLTKRVTYVIGPDGTVLEVVHPSNPKSHSQEALRVLREKVVHGANESAAAPR